jgi:two-component system alkaline phosphatase synthesis response regulator PhoP
MPACTSDTSIGKKVLIIDDQPFMIKLIQYNLKKRGYETITETDGLKALENIDNINPDLVILDIRMPRITGTELCRKFREKNNMKDIPIIILTGQLEGDAEKISRESGATDFMTKPFSPAVLASKMNQYLG